MTRVARVAGQLAAVALVLALLGLLGWKLTAGEGSQARIGEPAPGFQLPRLDDTERTLSLDSLSGSVVVVNFWASWCAPCRDEAPILEEASQKHASRGVVVLGVDARDFVADARTFVREFGITYDNVYDGAGKLVEQWGLTGFPETFVLDRSGVIVHHVAGPIESVEQLDAAIEKALP